MGVSGEAIGVESIGVGVLGIYRGRGPGKDVPGSRLWGYTGSVSEEGGEEKGEGEEEEEGEEEGEEQQH